VDFTRRKYVRKWKNDTRKESTEKRRKKRSGGGGERGVYMVYDFYISSMRKLLLDDGR